MKKKKRSPFFDKQWLGFIMGLLFPLLIFYLYYLSKFADLEFFDYLRSVHEYKLLFKTMSLCVLSNLPMFYLLLQFKYYKGTRGVVMACFIYAFFVLAYRIFN
ncbi:MAG: hypothetical protein PF541_07640 [Prolixibacteraceae bacterium]|nr:hypothetical protein [Prolixibacteraceae bacterium]